LVQWATYKKWGDIPDSIKQKHLDKDLPILKDLLKKDFEVMFLNGKSVVGNVCKCLGIKLKEKSEPFKGRSVTIYYGEYNGIEVIGWNLYLQSAACAGCESELCDLVKKNVELWRIRRN
jgi:hypothetical protein